MADKKENLHSGHRERMRQRLGLYGRESMHTHELLEMLLFHAIPYKNTNPLAINLLRTFGDLDGVLSATREELMSVDGVGPKIADVILAVGKITPVGSEKPFVENERHGFRFDDYRETGDFFVSYFGGRFSYETVILLLNSKMEYIDCKKLYDSDYDSGGIRAAAFIDAAVSSSAAVAVIAHNHPFGPLFPTEGDKATNKMVSDALSLAGVLLAEHYVVSGERFVGFMKHLSTSFSRPLEVERFFDSKRSFEET